MDSVARSFDPGPPKPISFANGTLKKHRPDEEHHRYRECLRNHAASLGGHAVDGCCEFMPSSSADPTVPTSLTCAACGCHRNFHRRLPSDPRLRHEETDGDDEDEDSSEDDDDGERRLSRSRRRSFVSPSPYSSSAPHMLLALSSSGGGGGGGGGGPVVGSTQSIAAPIAVASGGFQAAPTPRKRFRTKFSAEQKERMQEMSERLGWRLQRKDDALVDEFCRQIGVERVVFKVWMHNNKHNFHAGLSSRGREMGSGDGSGGGEGNGIGGGGGGADGGGGDSNYVMNGSPSSS